MEVIDNIMYFNNDDEFYKFCVVPKLIPIQYFDKSGNEKYYNDFNLSNRYNYALDKGIKFCIKDEDSQIYKHGCVSYRTITKEIDNLEPWFNDEC